MRERRAKRSKLIRREGPGPVASRSENTRFEGSATASRSLVKGSSWKDVAGLGEAYRDFLKRKTDPRRVGEYHDETVAEAIHAEVGNLRRSRDGHVVGVFRSSGNCSAGIDSQEVPVSSQRSIWQLRADNHRGRQYRLLCPLCGGRRQTGQDDGSVCHPSNPSKRRVAGFERRLDGS